MGEVVCNNKKTKNKNKKKEMEVVGGGMDGAHTQKKVRG